jgi:hypothetical protein
MVVGEAALDAGFDAHHAGPSGMPRLAWDEGAFPIALIFAPFLLGMITLRY